MLNTVFVSGFDIYCNDLGLNQILWSIMLQMRIVLKIRPSGLGYMVKRVLEKWWVFFVSGSGGVGYKCFPCCSVQVPPSLSQRLDYKLCLDSRLCGKSLLLCIPWINIISCFLLYIKFSKYCLSAFSAVDKFFKWWETLFMESANRPASQRNLLEESSYFSLLLGKLIIYLMGS